MDNIELQFINNLDKVKEADTRLTAKCCSLERLNKVNLPKIEALNKRLSLLEETVNNNTIKFKNVSNQVTKISQNLGNFQHETTKILWQKKSNALIC